MLILVVFSRLRLIIWWISIRLWLIIIRIMLSKILTIKTSFYFTKTIICGIAIFLPIGEKLVPIAGVAPIIIISSSPTSDLFPYSLIFLEDYEALSNHRFCCYCSLTSWNIVGREEFTGALGKYMCIISYFKIHKIFSSLIINIKNK